MTPNPTPVTTQVVADQLDVHRSTVINYINLARDFISESAQQPGRKKILTQADTEVITHIYDCKQQGMSDEDILASLKEGNRGWAIGAPGEGSIAPQGVRGMVLTIQQQNETITDLTTKLEASETKLREAESHSIENRVLQQTIEHLQQQINTAIERANESYRKGYQDGLADERKG